MRKRHVALFVLLAACFFAGLFYGHETQTNNDVWQVSNAVSEGDSLAKCRAQWAKRTNLRVDADGPSPLPNRKNEHVVVLRLNNNRILSSDSYLTLVFENGALKHKSYWDTWKWFD